MACRSFAFVSYAPQCQHETPSPRRCARLGRLVSGLSSGEKLIVAGVVLVPVTPLLAAGAQRIVIATVVIAMPVSYQPGLDATSSEGRRGGRGPDLSPATASSGKLPCHINLKSPA